MPAYNAEKTIKTAIKSILNQTLRDFEFIIINDGSTDKTKDIIKSFADSRIVLIDKPKNQGVASAINDGIEIAKGKYIARMDADDESLPERFTMQIDFFNKNPDIDVLGTAIFSIAPAKNKITRFPKKHYQCLNELTRGVCIAHPSAMLRKNIIKRVKYKPKYFAEDYKLWVDLAKQGAKFANLTTPLLKYNIHGENISIIKNKEQQDSTNLIKKEYLEFYLGVIYPQYSKELDWLADLSTKNISLTALNHFYRSLNLHLKHNKKNLKIIFKRAIKNHIYLLQYQWNIISPILLLYFLRYKLKQIIKK